MEKRIDEIDEMRMASRVACRVLLADGDLRGTMTVSEAKKYLHDHKGTHYTEGDLVQDDKGPKTEKVHEKSQAPQDRQNLSTEALHDIIEKSPELKKHDHGHPIVHDGSPSMQVNQDNRPEPTPEEFADFLYSSPEEIAEKKRLHDEEVEKVMDALHQQPPQSWFDGPSDGPEHIPDVDSFAESPRAYVPPGNNDNIGKDTGTKGFADRFMDVHKQHIGDVLDGVDLSKFRDTVHPAVKEALDKAFPQKSPQNYRNTVSHMFDVASSVPSDQSASPEVKDLAKQHENYWKSKFASSRDEEIASRIASSILAADGIDHTMTEAQAKKYLDDHKASGKRLGDLVADHVEKTSEHGMLQHHHRALQKAAEMKHGVTPEMRKAFDEDYRTSSNNPGEWDKKIRLPGAPHYAMANANEEAGKEWDFAAWKLAQQAPYSDYADKYGKGELQRIIKDYHITPEQAVVDDDEDEDMEDGDDDPGYEPGDVDEHQELNDFAHDDDFEPSHNEDW
jgi:hypothetical protein